MSGWEAMAQGAPDPFFAEQRPGWVKPCTCGQTERGAYCHDCKGFGDGFSAGVWERPVIKYVDHEPQEQAEDFIPEPPPELPQVKPETWCPGGHRGATVRGNAAYCAECGGRLKPTASSRYTHGTGH